MGVWSSHLGPCDKDAPQPTSKTSLEFSSRIMSFSSGAEHSEKASSHQVHISSNNRERQMMVNTPERLSVTAALIAQRSSTPHCAASWGNSHCGTEQSAAASVCGERRRPAGLSQQAHKYRHGESWWKLRVPVVCVPQCVLVWICVCVFPAFTVFDIPLKGLGWTQGAGQTDGCRTGTSRHQWSRHWATVDVHSSPLNHLKLLVVN